MINKVLEVKDVYFDEVNENKTHSSKFVRLLNGISVNFESGKLTAIMGSNGSGKSTLMNLMIGRVSNESKTSGSLKYCGEEIRNAHFWCSKVAFLQQKEEYINSLTVEEYLRFEIILYREELSQEEQDKLLVDVMTESRIIHKRNEILEHLSGGETKKVMIAGILLQNAEILFMDEPTSWLDSYNALSFIRTMKEVASKRNVIIAIIINQPGQDLFELFDDLIFINPGGNLFYSGPITEVDEFLKSNSFNKPDDLKTVYYLFSLGNPGSNLYIPPEHTADVNYHRSSVTTYSLLNETYYGSSYSKKGIVTLIKRRLAYGYNEGEFGIWFFLRLFIAIGISLLFVFNDSYKSNSFKDLSNLQYGLKRIIYLLRFNSNGHFSLILALLFSPSFYGKGDIFKNEILFGKYSSYTLFLASFIYDFFFKMAAVLILISISLITQPMYLFTSLWPFIYLIFSVAFMSLNYLVLSTMKSRIYWCIVLYFYVYLLMMPPEMIRTDCVSYLPYYLLTYLLFFFNPASFLKIAWLQLLSKSSVLAGMTDLEKDAKLIDSFLYKKDFHLSEAVFGIRCNVLVLCFAFLDFSILIIGTTYFTFLSRVSPSLRLKLKN